MKDSIPRRPPARLAALCLFVSTRGRDTWSGRLPAPNRGRTDGPFASIVRARDEIRRLKAGGRLEQPVTVRIRGGTYFIPSTLVLGPADSGAEGCPIVYEAYPGETPVLSGGRPITGWRRWRGPILRAPVPGAAGGGWYFRSLFAGGERQVRARYPNANRKDPYRRGFLYVAGPGAKQDRLGVVNVFHAGDFLTYECRVPGDGLYDLWVLYSGNNQAFGIADMAGRTSLHADGGPAQPLVPLPASGALRWSRCARLALRRGRHTLTWRNDRGGMINLKTFALCADPRWAPEGKQRQPPRGARPVFIRAVDFRTSNSKELLIQPLGGASYGKQSFPFRAGDVKASWAKEPNAEVHVYPSAGCASYYLEIARLEGVDAAARRVRLGGPGCVGTLAEGNRYFVENILEELDSPGEWYLDRRKGMLYHWPRGNRRRVVIAPVLGRLLQLDAVMNVALSGLTFQETDHSPDDGCLGTASGRNGTLHLRHAADCRIVNCRFRNIGPYAICLDESRQVALEGNDVAGGAEGGILLVNSAGNRVADNHIHNCGKVYKHVGGIVLEGPASGGNDVVHNAIHDMPRYGISLKYAGVRNRIEYNEVFNANLETYDSGGIEVTQHDRALNSRSTIRFNRIHDTIGYSSDAGLPLFGSWAIYLDSFAGGYTVSHNLAYRNTWGGVLIQGGRQNRVFNNILIGGYTPGSILNFADNSRRLRFERNLVGLDGPADLFYLGAVSRRILRCDRNLYFGAGAGRLTLMWPGRWPQNVWEQPDFTAWQKAGFDRRSLVADPRFVNPAADDYRLRHGSPAFRLGFEPIDARAIGLLRRRCRCARRPILKAFGHCALRCAACRERRPGATPPCRLLVPPTPQ